MGTDNKEVPNFYQLKENFPFIFSWGVEMKHQTEQIVSSMIQAYKLNAPKETIFIHDGEFTTVSKILNPYLKDRVTKRAKSIMEKSFERL